MTTLGLGIVFLALLMIYCGVKGKSLRAALLGHSVDGGGGSLLAGTTTSTSSSSSTSSTASQATAPNALQSLPAPR